jgi:hypothetical protein
MTIQAILAAMLAVGAPIANEVLNGASIQMKKEVAATQWTLGKDKIAQIRAAYEKGEYADFLKGMDDSYLEVHSQDQLGSLVLMRESENTPDLKKWEEQAHLLQEEGNSELTKAIQEDNSLFAEKVRSAIASKNVDEQKALLDLSQYRYMQPQTGKNSDENTLVDLDLEYEYKSIHLNTPLKTDLSSQQKRELHIVLQMEKMDKMKRAGLQDASLKKKIALVSENFDQRLAQHWDAADLNALAKNQIKPHTTTEAMVASILSEKHAKFNELFKQYLDAQ